MATIIKFFSIYLCTVYIYFKILNTTPSNKLCKIILFFTLPILTIIATFLCYNFTELSYLIPLLLLWIILSTITLLPQNSFITMITSFAISFIFYAIASFFITAIFYPLFPNYHQYPFFLLAILSSISQILLCIGLFKIKRFKKGMPFLFSTGFVNIATIICLILIASITYISFDYLQDKLQISVFIFLIFTLALLIYWWQAQLIKTYKQRLILRELESLRIELEEKEETIAKLSKQNEEFGRLIHKDNKLIPAMEHAVCEYLISDFTDADDTKKTGNSLLLEIRSLSNSRVNILSEIGYGGYKSYSTGLISLDTILNYMSQRALKEGTRLTVHVGLELSSYIPDVISADDLTHLVSDLLDNALIATSDCRNAVVQLQFYEAENSFILEIADTGIPFEIDSLLNFGLVSMTTHSSTGGSGIGLMDIWKHKEHYSATLHIEECKEDAAFTKKISMIFDKKNKYTIQTWRKDEISQLSQRTDLQVYDYSD